jgi:hypothetical protein
MHAEVHESDADAPHGYVAHRAVVEIMSFEQQIAEVATLSQAPDLGPERAGDDGCVKPANGLSLDKSPYGDLVVPCVQAPDFDVSPEPGEAPRDPVGRFARIHDDPRHDRIRMAITAPLVCRNHVANPQLLALSRSESA